MPVNPNIAAHVQGSSLGGLIQLFDIDTTPVGGTDVLRFSPAPSVGGLVTWRGNVYALLPITAQGFDKNGTGKPARPTLQMANTLRVGSALVQQYGELEGCTVTRWRVFEKFLDNQATADPDAYVSLETYEIDRKSAHNPQVVEWELASYLDQTGVLLPRGQVLRDVCMLSYRVYNATTGDFDYRKATCPYVGGGYFDQLGNETTIDQDSCSHRFTNGCLLRFPVGDIPFGGFPAVEESQS